MKGSVPQYNVLRKKTLSGGTQDEKDSITGGSMSRNSRFSPAARKKVSIGVNPGVDVCRDDEWMSVTSRNVGVGKELWSEVVETIGDQKKEKTESSDSASGVESDPG